MTFLQPFLRLVAIGDIYATDTFSFSMALITSTEASASAPSTVPAGVVTAFEAFWQSEGVVSTQARLQTLKLNEIGVDGRYTGDDTVLHDYPDPGVPGAVSIFPPPQISYAVSLRTEAARGRAHAGRFYLPLPGGGPQTSGMLAVASVTSIKAAVDNLLEDINAAMVGWRVGVVSDLGSGQQREVTHARYGRVLDTIRSRRNKFTEDYMEGTALPPGA